MPGGVQLYLVRHAIAEDRGDAWPDDRLRPLADVGKQRMRRQARSLVALGISFDQILTSPLVRTRETADILAEAFPAPPRIVEVEALEPDRRPKEVLGALRDFSRRTSLALIGHEPGIGEVAGVLLGMRSAMPFKKGAIALIEVALLPPPPGSGELRWFVPPRFLRKVSD
jgi:phosphohistidine phosphatase